MTTTSRKHRLSEWFKLEKARHRAAQVADAFLKDPEPARWGDSVPTRPQPHDDLFDAAMYAAICNRVHATK